MNVVKFLFGLEGLSVYFVMVMAIIFIAGVMYAVKTIHKFSDEIEDLKKQYTESGNKYATRLTPQEFFALHLDEGHASHLLAAIPGFLVSLGILGTFIGLGIAVGEASGAMGSNLDSVESMTKMQTALNQLLTAISFKFQASAWGILSSLIFSSTVQIWFGARLEDLVETASRDIMGSYQTPAAAIAAELERLESALEKSLSPLGPQLGNVLRNAIQVLEKNISQPMQNMNQEILKLATALTIVSDSAKKMQASAEGLGNMSEKVDESLKNVSQTIGQQLGQANLQTKHSLENMEKSISQSSKKQIETAENQLTAMQNSLQDMKKSIQESSQGQVTAARQMSQDVNATIKHMQTEINRLLEMSNAIQTKSEERMKDIGVAIRSMDGSINKVDITLTESAEVNKNMANVFHEMSGILGGLQFGQISSSSSMMSQKLEDSSALASDMNDWSAPVNIDAEI